MKRCCVQEKLKKYFMQEKLPCIGKTEAVLCAGTAMKMPCTGEARKLLCTGKAEALCTGKAMVQCSGEAYKVQCPRALKTVKLKKAANLEKPSRLLLAQRKLYLKTRDETKILPRPGEILFGEQI